MILDGGWSSYKETQPTTQQYASYKSARLPIHENAAITADLRLVTAAIGNSGIKFIDVRPAAQYAGEVKTFLRHGHIPGAINIDWR